MRAAGLVVALFGFASANNSTCGSDPTKVTDCDKPDMGSCGNACCIMDFSVDSVTPLDAYNALTKALKTGGTDGSYTYSHAADSAGHNPSDNLTQYSIAWLYIFQGTHMTTGGYVDTMDFNIKKAGANTVIRVFSVSNIHGALGDGGQSFKNIKFLFDGIKPTGRTTNGMPPEASIVHGCGTMQGAVTAE